MSAFKLFCPTNFPETSKYCIDSNARPEQHRRLTTRTFSLSTRVGEDKGSLFIASELVEGQDSRDLLHGEMTCDQALAFAKQI